MTPLLEIAQIIVMILFWISIGTIIICIYTFAWMVMETKLPGKRLFGLNCDGCLGKFRKNGKPLYRCYIKKPILKLLIRYGLITKVLKPPASNNQ